MTNFKSYIISFIVIAIATSKKLNHNSNNAIKSNRNEEGKILRYLLNYIQCKNLEFQFKNRKNQSWIKCRYLIN